MRERDSGRLIEPERVIESIRDAIQDVLFWSTRGDQTELRDACGALTSSLREACDETPDFAMTARAIERLNTQVRNAPDPREALTGLQQHQDELRLDSIFGRQSAGLKCEDESQSNAHSMRTFGDSQKRFKWTGNTDALNPETVELGNRLLDLFNSGKTVGEVNQTQIAREVLVDLKLAPSEKADRDSAARDLVKALRKHRGTLLQWPRQAKGD